MSINNIYIEKFINATEKAAYGAYLHIGKGDKIAADEPIVELETDKVNLEVPSPISGVLTEINSKDGSVVEVGALLGSVSESSSGLQENEEIDPDNSYPGEDLKSEDAKPDFLDLDKDGDKE